MLYIYISIFKSVHYKIARPIIWECTNCDCILALYLVGGIYKPDVANMMHIYAGHWLIGSQLALHGCPLLASTTLIQDTHEHASENQENWDWVQ